MCGFDEFFGFLVGGHNYALRKDAEPKFASAMSENLIYRGREVQKLDGFATDLFTDEAIGFMKRHKDQPWFLYLAYNAVHTPLEISDKLKERVPATSTIRHVAAIWRCSSASTMRWAGFWLICK